MEDCFGVLRVLGLGECAYEKGFQISESLTVQQFLQCLQNGLTVSQWDPEGVHMILRDPPVFINLKEY